MSEISRDTPDNTRDASPETPRYGGIAVDDREAPPGYELHDEIGRGGMGIVFRGRDTRLNRDVALKFLHERFAPESHAARRFLDEARITAQLQHPGIPPVHEVGSLRDGRPYLVMKLIKGRTLSNMLADEAVSRGFLIAAFEHVCQAVAYAHNHGIVHRDLKPQNVMVGAFGEIQVMDWGLAKYRAEAKVQTLEAASASTFHDPRMEEDDDYRTRTGSFVGTPAYMSPEQAIGAVDRIDERSDVFGLGGILCAILTGRAPYVGDSGESTRQMAAAAKLGGAFARLDTCYAEPELVALCKRCLSPEPDDRPPHAGALAKAVAALRQAADERARQAEIDRVRADGELAKAEAEAREQRKRRKAQFALALAVALLVAGAGAFAYWQERQRASAAQLAGERDAEIRLKAEQAHKGVVSNLQFANELRRRYRYDEADVAIDQAAAMANDAAAELKPEVERAKRDLQFARKLDDIRFRKWVYVSDPNGGGSFSTKIAPPEYKAAFIGYGLDLLSLEPATTAKRIAASEIKAEMVAALDDWALYEPDEQVRERLLWIARLADPGSWSDQLRDAAKWNDPNAIAQLATDADPKTASSQALSMLATLMVNNRLDPAAMLTAARAAHPSDFELAFALGQSMTSDEGREIGPYEAARAIRPENLTVWNNLGIALKDKGNYDAATAIFKEILKRDPKRASAYNNLGVALNRKGDFAGAIAAHEEAIQLGPNDAAAHNNLGLVLKNKGDLEAAIVAYQNAIRADPTHANAHTNLGNVLRTKGDLDGAIAAHKEAIKQDPRSGLAYYNLGNSLDERGDIDGAIAAYREAIRIDPQDSRAHNNLGSALKKKGDVDGAIAAYRAALRQNPNHTNAILNLGMELHGKGGTEEAAELYRAAIRRDANNADAHIGLGTILQDRGDLRGAIATYKEAIRVDPKNAMAHYNLGNALHDLGDNDGAIAAYREAIKHNPKYVKALHNLGNLLLDRGEADAAKALYEEAIKHDSNHAGVRTSLGNTRLAKGDIEGAIAAHREAIRIDPKNSIAHFNLGIALRRKGDLDGAIAAYRESIKCDPKHGDAYMNLMIALQLKGDAEGVKALYAMAMRHVPKHARVHYNGGNFFNSLGNVEAAITAWKRAIEADPKFAAAHRNLGLALKNQGDIDGAIACYREALKHDPKFAPAHNSLGMALQSKGDFDGAVVAYQEAIKYGPKIAYPFFNLALILATGPDKYRDGKKAIALATRACELTAWRNATYLSALGCAHAEAGDFDKAIEDEKKAQTSPDYQRRYGPEGKQRLELYGQKKPYRDPALTLRK